MKSKSIRYYFFTSITTVLVASVMVMGLIQTWLASEYFREEKEELLDQVTRVVSDGIQSEELDLYGQSLQSLQTVDYMSRVSGAAVFITDTTGAVQYSTGVGAPLLGSQVDRAVMADLRENGHYSEQGHLNALFETNHFVRALRLRNVNDQVIGYVFAAADAAALQVYVWDTITTFILSAGVVLLVSSILALVLSNRTIIPIRRLSDAARHFAEGDFSARVPVEGDDELATLSITFNEMANSFESTDVSRRSFMGNIAHELRTPMTTIKGFIDGMLDGTIPVDQRDRYLMVVSDEVGRLARLTRNMLDISRLEAGEYTPNNTTFDIWGPLATVMLSAEQRLLDKQLRVEGMEHDAPCWVEADEDFVHQILFNLTDNAIKFAGEDGYIAVSVAESKGMVTIGIRNSGAGVEPGTLAHVFDRFYKADQSRGMNARGAGLGLHISKVLVGLMGGRIWAESELGAWTEFLFTLPAAPARRGKKKPADAPED